MNKEKTEINIEGIRVKSEKKTIYFLFATDPFTFIFAFIEFDISLKIKIKNKIKKIIFT